MRNFNEWLQFREYIETMGPEAEATFHKIVDMLRPFTPGKKLTIIHEMPTHHRVNGEEAGLAGYHVFRNEIEIDSRGVWEMKPANKFNGDTEFKPYGFIGNSYFGKQNTLKAIENEVSAAYYHAGKIWVIKDGHKIMMKDATLNDPRGLKTLVARDKATYQPHFGEPTTDREIYSGLKPDPM